MDEKKIKRGIYISCFGVLISIIVVIVQALTPIPITTGLGILFANLTILLVNVSRYKAYKQTEEVDK